MSQTAVLEDARHSVDLAGNDVEVGLYRLEGRERAVQERGGRATKGQTMRFLNSCI